MRFVLFLVSAMLSAAAQDYSAFAGEWRGHLAIGVTWTKARSLSASLRISSDGAVSGNIGDATITTGRIYRKCWFKRQILRHEDAPLISVRLDGPLIAAENIRRDTMLLHVRMEQDAVRCYWFSSSGWKMFPGASAQSMRNQMNLVGRGGLLARAGR